MPRKNQNPVVEIVLTPLYSDLIRCVLVDHEPIVKMRPSERAMEVSSTRMLVEEWDSKKVAKSSESVTIALPLASWGEVIHAVACRYKRLEGSDVNTGLIKRECMTLFRWLRSRLAADPAASAVLAEREEVAARAREVERLTRARDLAEAKLAEAVASQKRRRERGRP